MKKVIFLSIVFSIAGVPCVNAHEAWQNQIELPSQLLGEVQRQYITQGGKCEVKVKEQIVLGDIQVGDTTIIYPYICVRKNHVYHCPPPIPRRGGARSPTHQYPGQVTANYEVVDGNLASLSNITNPNNNEETDCGAVIVEYLKSITLQ